MRTLIGQSIPNITAPTASFPYGRAKDSSPPSSRNGTPLKEANLITDTQYSILAVMKEAGLAPNEQPEEIDNSQFKDAILSLINSAVNSALAPIVVNISNLFSGVLTINNEIANILNSINTQGNFYCKNNTMCTIISAAGMANKAKFEHFQSVAPVFGVLFDLDENKVIIQSNGVYEIIVSVSATSCLVAVGGDFVFEIFKGGGTIPIENTYSHQTIDSGPGKYKNIVLSGQWQFVTNDELELFVWNETNGRDIILSDVSFSIKKIRPL